MTTLIINQGYGRFVSGKFDKGSRRLAKLNVRCEVSTCWQYVKKKIAKKAMETTEL